MSLICNVLDFWKVKFIIANIHWQNESLTEMSWPYILYVYSYILNNIQKGQVQCFNLIYDGSYSKISFLRHGPKYPVPPRGKNRNDEWVDFKTQSTMKFRC